MATLQSLADLNRPTPRGVDPANEPPSTSRSWTRRAGAYATASARTRSPAWIKPGTGKVVVNKRPVETYFALRCCA